MSNSNSYYKTRVATQAEDPKKKLTSSTKGTAQIINYAELEKVMLQNVGRNITKTYTQYSKERLQSFITSPYSNLNNIRDVSNFLWRVSMPYKKIIEYYSQMPMFSYNLVPKLDFDPNLSSDAFLSDFQEVSRRLENIKFKEEGPNILATALRDGAYFGFVYDNEESCFLDALDPRYCKISSKSDGVYNIAFDASFFDQGDNIYFLQAEEGAWDEVFLDGYNQYKSGGQDYRWFELPPEKTICIIAGDDPLVPLPYFLSVFVDLLDLLDYQALVRSKTELENYVLLVSKIPMLKNSDQVNDFAVDLDLVEYTQNMIDEVVPSLAATAFTPCELETIRFNNENQVADTNIYVEALTNFMNNIGVSEMIGNSDKGGSVGLAASIKTDELLSIRLVNRLERWAQRYLYLNISEDFILKFHPITYFSKDAYLNQLKDQATLGVPVKMDYATASGYTPYEIMNATYFEKSLMLSDLWEPLASSYTQSGSDTGGAPTKDDDEISEEGQDTRDSGKNEGTEARTS